ncbi:unnamed protein product [Ambrosiozyma monospora]|uniref:Unnamed protein product n=1 Tax=Ambrosiozyma monospora TaxID=43982 RepID=A0ACB5SXG1_AMBMO|nr:unnamed protein product [Ambrosiozyma monospora]
MTVTQAEKPSEKPRAKLPEGYTIRRIQADDYERGVLKTLECLTEVGDISKEEYTETIEFWESQEGYNTLVILDDKDQVAGVGTLMIERKLIHRCSKIGHIEDISISDNHQGKGLGKFLIQSLTDMSKEKGCYKTILDCATKNEGFYEACGLKNVGSEMEIRH